MDGENHGKPYEQMDDLGGFPIIFGNAHLASLISTGFVLLLITCLNDMQTKTTKTHLLAHLFLKGLPCGELTYHFPKTCMIFPGIQMGYC